VTKGLVLHVDAPVKQVSCVFFVMYACIRRQSEFFELIKVSSQCIIAEDKKHNGAIVLSELHNDENKIFVNITFEDVSGNEQDTVTWLQVSALHNTATQRPTLHHTYLYIMPLHFAIPLRIMPLHFAIPLRFNFLPSHFTTLQREAPHSADALHIFGMFYFLASY